MVNPKTILEKKAINLTSEQKQMVLEAMIEFGNLKVEECASISLRDESGEVETGYYDYLYYDYLKHKKSIRQKLGEQSAMYRDAESGNHLLEFPYKAETNTYTQCCV